MIMRRVRLIPILVAMISITSASDSSNKRAPSGFQGVRGKKSIPDTYPDNIPDSIDMDMTAQKRIPSLSSSSYDLQLPIYPERNYVAADVPKRAPKGFLGMRGKKEMEYVEDDLVEKRAPVGFMGMRGKKEDENEFLYKRGPSGFLGMRGKKEYDLDEEKRTPFTSFFGIRGKKQPSWTSFFGMRGKKYPYEFRGKFVGVRGKKQSEENSLPDFETEDTLTGNNAFTNLDLNELMVLLQDNNNYNNDALSWEKRKGPSGFLGMRG